MSTDMPFSISKQKKIGDAIAVMFVTNVHQIWDKRL